MNAIDSHAQVLRIEVAGGDDTPELDASGDWVWTVFYDTDENGGAATIEFGIQATGTNLLSGEVNATGLGGGDVEIGVPGRTVFGWESVDAPDGNGTLPSGFQIDLEENGLGEAYFSFLTGILPANSTIELAQFVTDGPSTVGLTSGLQLVGAYDSSGSVSPLRPGTRALISEADGSTLLSTTNSVTALLGDVNLDGEVTQADRDVVAANFGLADSTAGWVVGDFNGDGSVNDTDVGVFGLETGDADLDGEVDRDDYNVAAANFGLTDTDVGSVGGDFDGDRDVDGADLAVFNDLVDAVNYSANDTDQSNDARVIDAADYTVWRDNFESQNGLIADGDGDGVVSPLDRDLWVESYGINLFDPAPVTVATAVPEPTALGLMLLAAPAALRRRSR